MNETLINFIAECKNDGIHLKIWACEEMADYKRNNYTHDFCINNNVPILITICH